MWVDGSHIPPQKERTPHTTLPKIIPHPNPERPFLEKSKKSPVVHQYYINSIGVDGEIELAQQANYL